MRAHGARGSQAHRRRGAARCRGQPCSQIRSSGFVLDTERAALWCLANTSSFAECVLAAVNLGGDTDTTAAVAGGLAGIAYGMGGIPAEWLDALLGKATIDACMF